MIQLFGLFFLVTITLIGGIKSLHNYILGKKFFDLSSRFMGDVTRLSPYQMSMDGKGYQPPKKNARSLPLLIIAVTDFILCAITLFLLFIKLGL